jgi:hypothetical protein
MPNIPNDIAARRIRYLIDEAKSLNPQYDMSITFTMRLISNYASIEIGAADSEKVKRLNTRMSTEARKLFNKVDFTEFHEATINEHPFPLKKLWEHIVKEHSSLTPEEVWHFFVKYPMITVTKPENKRLGFIKAFDSAEHRYELASITISI